MTFPEIAEEGNEQVHRVLSLFSGCGGMDLGFEGHFIANKKSFPTDDERIDCELNDNWVLLKKNNFKTVFANDILPEAQVAWTEYMRRFGYDSNIYHCQSIVELVKMQKAGANIFPKNIDVVLGGFPCQDFSVAGKGLGFMDTRGTLFFEIERLIAEATAAGNKPKGFILENVEGLVTHGEKVDDPEYPGYGSTLITIIKKLKKAGYHVEVKVINAAEYGLPQKRNRVYIVGVDERYNKVNLENLPVSKKTFGDIMDHGLPTIDSKFTKALLKSFSPEELIGKGVKDKRGGNNNIHSWDLEIKGPVSQEEKAFLNQLLHERRKHKWAEIIGIDWMDGMPLTKDQIETFYHKEGLQAMLDHLVDTHYLVYEHPKKKVKHTDGQNTSYSRVPDTTLPKGYNIVTGKLSFEFSQFLDPQEPTPTMVAMDMQRVGVVDGNGVRHLSIPEGLKLFGYCPTDLSYLENRKNGKEIAFDLLGNSVCVPVIKLLAGRLLNSIMEGPINE